MIETRLRIEHVPRNAIEGQEMVMLVENIQAAIRAGKLVDSLLPAFTAAMTGIFFIKLNIPWKANVPALASLAAIDIKHFWAAFQPVFRRCHEKCKLSKWLY